MTAQGMSACEAAAKHVVTPPTAKKWLGALPGRRCCRPGRCLVSAVRSPRSIEPGKALLIVELRQRRMLHSRIAQSVGVSETTVSRVLARAGLSKLSDLEPRDPVQRYQHKQPVHLLHIDTKKLGRI